MAEQNTEQNETQNSESAAHVGEGATAQGSQQPAVQTPPAAGEEVIKLTPQQLSQRLERAVRSYVRKLGLESPDELAQAIQRLREMEQQEEERRKAQMSEVERLQAELAELKRAQEQAAEEAERARVEAHLTRLFAEKGIRNHDYATWKLMQAVNELEDDDELDEEKFLQQLMEDPKERIALGIEEPPVTTQAPEQHEQKAPVPVPATTTPATGPGQAPPPPKPGEGTPVKTAFDLSPEEWAKRKAELGIA